MSIILEVMKIGGKKYKRCFLILEIFKIIILKKIKSVVFILILYGGMVLCLNIGLYFLVELW